MMNIIIILTYHLIKDQNIFKQLLWKLEDFNSILYEWYNNESKFDLLKDLWKSKLCIYNLSKDSDEELE